MQQYPYSSPQILTDAIFLMYGGQTGSSTNAQRQAAFLIAEQKMTEHLSAFLVPTIITGTAFWRGDSLFETEFGYLHNVLLVSAEEIKQINPLQTRIVTGSAMIRNAENGYLDLFFPCPYGLVYSNTVVYESGLATGTVSNPIMLSALVMAAQIHLNMWVQDLANESTADIGVQSFSANGYSESRVKLGRTVFGNSAVAQQIASMTKQYRTKQGTSFR